MANLTELEFIEYEAKVYLALLDDSRLSVAELAKMPACRVRMDDPYVVALDVEVCDYVWMDLFVWRIFAHIGSELLARLDPADRRVFESAKT